MQDTEYDMNALINAHTHRGRSRSPHVGLTPNVTPEAQRSQTGVSSDYAHKEGHHWFVLRVTYNRTEKARVIIANAEVHLTSSLRHPKILIKEFSYFLMPCHQHGLRINLLV